MLKILPTRLEVRAYLIITILITLPMIFFSIYSTSETKERLLLEREKQLFIIANTLRARLPDSYSDLLDKYNASSLTDDEKTIILHRELQPIVTDVSRSWPGYGMGYHSLELGRLAFAPQTDLLGQKTVAPAALRVYQSKQPEVYILESSVTREGITVLAMSFPLLENDEAIGHIWVNYDIRDIIALFHQKLAEQFLITISLWLGLLILARVFFRQFKGYITEIVQNGKNDPETLVAFPELNPLAEALLALQDKEKRLEIEVNRLNTLFNVMPAGIFLANKDGKIIEKNELADRIWGGNGVFSKSGQEYVEYKAWYLDGRQLRAEDWACARALKGEYITSEVLDIQKFDGSYGTILNSAAPIIDTDGNIQGAVVAVSDITEQSERARELEMLKNNLERIAAEKIEEATIKERERIEALERFEHIFRFGYTPKWLIRAKDWMICDVNNAWELLTGFTKAEALGRTSEELELINVNSQDVIEYRQNLFQNGTAHQEVRITRKDGEVRQIIASSTKMAVEEDYYYLFSAHDITEIRKMEAEIARIDCLNLVGEMAAGIGHEVRNPMTTVRGFLQILRSKEEFLRYRGYLDMMIEELDRANEIISEYLSLAKNKRIEMKKGNINNILIALQPLLEADGLQRGHTIRLVTSPIPDIDIDESEIRQLILNLVRNGFESMPEKGTVTITTYNQGDLVVLAIQDTGSGISPEIQEKIGTPFNTNKENGTGLGLSVCYRIAQRHNAKIDFKTGPEGTVFFVRFNPKPVIL